MTQPAPQPALPFDQPHADALVLQARPLRPGITANQLSRFADDRWLLTPGIFEDNATAVSVDFTTVPPPFRLSIKLVTWLLINHDDIHNGSDVARFNARTSVLALRTIAAVFRHLRALADWLTSRGRTRFSEVTPADLDDYAVHVKAASISHKRREDLLSAVLRLWSLRSLLPDTDRLPVTPPWRGERIQDLLGHRRGSHENLTPRINPDTMSALLVWSLRFVEILADDIIAAFADYTSLCNNTVRRRGLRPSPPRRPPHGVVDELAQLLDRYRAHVLPLPGLRNNDGTLRINAAHLARQLDCMPHALATDRAVRTIADSGLPLADDAYLLTPITALLDGRPWRTTPITYHRAEALARHLSTACAVVIGYLSGMRPGEVASLERGCLTRDPSTGLVLLRGRHWKGVRTATGAKLPHGQIRHDPWVVAEPVATAVSVLERLHTAALLFPTTLHTNGNAGPQVLHGRVGKARSDSQLNLDITHLIGWINQYCAGQRRTDPIPPDPHAPITVSRLRRTLAWFIARRPRGLVAAAVQYGHLRVQMTLGYAGSYVSGFPDDLAFEDWLARLEQLADAHHRLDAGEHISGPAADTYRHRVHAATRFAGRVLRTKREAVTLLANPDLQIYPSYAVTCVFDPQRAACRTRTDENTTRRTPDLSDCRPHCGNIARTDRDVATIHTQIDQLRRIVNDPLAPPIRHARLQHELHRLEAIADQHNRPGTSDHV